MVSRRNFLGSVSAASVACFVKDSLALPAAFHTYTGNGIVFGMRQKQPNLRLF